MTKSARQAVFEGMELLPEALVPFVEGRLSRSLSGHWQARVAQKLPDLRVRNGKVAWDLLALMHAMDRLWTNAFADLGRSVRSQAIELIDVRNKLSHNEPFSLEDAERALDTMRRVLQAADAMEAASHVAALRDEILRTRMADQGKPGVPASQAPVALQRSPVKRPRNRSQKTTEPGYRNRNGQVVVRKTDLPGTDHMQRIYVLRCDACSHEYGANGSDIHLRRCPACGAGAPGLAFD